MISAIDLFCGIGGLSYGLKKSGIKIWAGVDLDNSCEYAYSKNVKADFIHSDIASIGGQELLDKYWNNENEIKILVGCAPCQPFSSHSNKVKGREGTEKWNLIKVFERLISETVPQIVSMENVPNLSNQIVIQEFVNFLESNNYSVSFENVYYNATLSLDKKSEKIKC